MLAPELQQSGLKLPAEIVMTQQAGDTFGQNRLQQHRSCGSLALHQSLFLPEKRFQDVWNVKFSCCWPQFRSALTLARVAVLKTEWRLQPLPLTRREVMIYQWGLVFVANWVLGTKILLPEDLLQGQADL